MSFKQMREILERAARAEGLDKYEIYYTASSSMCAETLGDEISSFSGRTEGGISFRCVVGGKVGIASTELITEEELCALVLRARANAEVIESEHSAVIFGGSENYKELEKKEYVMPSASEIKQLALDIQRRTYAESEHVTDGTQSLVACEQSRYELANSEGLHLSAANGIDACYAVAVVSKNGEASDAYEAKIGLNETEGLSTVSVNGALSKIGAEGVPTGKTNVIIEGKAMRSLLSAYFSVFSGKQAFLGLSLLAGKEGERIASECVTLIDSPYGEYNFVPIAFDGEGVATYEKNVIENGVLKTLLYDIAYADKVGKASTGNGQRGSYASQVNIAPYCFYIKGGELSESELLEKMGNGLYVTELRGLHAGANAVTGDFSIECAGQLVENGKRTKSVKGFTVAGNFFELLQGIVALSDNVKFGLPSGFTTLGAPDTFVGEMSVAGE